MPLPLDCSLQNAKNHHFRCHNASELRDAFSNPDCLMKLIPYGDGVYAIQNVQNKKFFQASHITKMADGVTSDDQKWRIAEALDRNHAVLHDDHGNILYTIRSMTPSGKYMTSSAGSLSKTGDAEEQRWAVQDRTSLVLPLVPNYTDSYYGTLMNVANGHYRSDDAKKLTADVKIPANLFKMIRLADGNHALQSQENYAFFQAPIAMSDSVYGPQQEWVIAGWKENLPIPDAVTIRVADDIKQRYMTSDGSKLSEGASYPEQVWSIRKVDCTQTASWMNDNWESLTGKSLSAICVPGSHDSGTFMATDCTSYGGENVTATQLFDIQMQLMQGVRAFDLRPVLYKAGFYTAHYSKLDQPLGYQGAIGVQLQAALEQVRAFVSMHKKELVILNFSHYLNWDDRNTRPSLSGAQWEQLLDLVRSSLGDVLIRGEQTNLCALTIDELLARGNVLAVFGDLSSLGNTKVNTPEMARSGIWTQTSAMPMQGCYSDTENLDRMMAGQKQNLLQSSRTGQSAPFMFEMCWQLTLGSLANTPLVPGSVLSLAKKANKELSPVVTGWLHDGVINQDVYPNFINTDACYEGPWHGKDDPVATRAVALSVAINKLLKVRVPAA